MVSITFSIPEETRRLMKESPEINWTHIVRTAINEQAKKVELKKQLMQKLNKEKDFMNWSVNVVREGRHKK